MIRDCIISGADSGSASRNYLPRHPLPNASVIAIIAEHD